MKKANPNPSETRDTKPSSNVKHLMDTEVQIADPSSDYHLENLRFNLYGSHVRGENPFRVVQKDVDFFHAKFDKRVRAGFPSYWDFVGMLIPWTQYNQMLVEGKSKADSSHEKIAILKGKTMVNYLRNEFQLLGLIKTFFQEGS